MMLIMKTFVALAGGALMAAPALADENASGKLDKDKLICKTETVVGSLIPGPRRCHTRVQWEEHSRAGQAIARKLVEDGTGRPSLSN